MTESRLAHPWWDRFAPRAGVRLQLLSAAALWLVGTSFLLVRGVLFIERPGLGFHFSYAIVPVALVAIALGAIKARYILIRCATRAVARIQRRGHVSYVGFFAPHLVAVRLRDDGRRHPAAPLGARGLRVGPHPSRHALHRRGHRLGHRRPRLLERGASFTGADYHRKWIIECREIGRRTPCP
jgi:hypothetical protein